MIRVVHHEITLPIQRRTSRSVQHSLSTQELPTLLAHTLLLISATLLRDHDFLHLLDGNCTFNVDPLVLYHVLLFQFQDEVHTANVFERDKAKPSRFIRALVLEYDTVFDLAEI